MDFITKHLPDMSIEIAIYIALSGLIIVQFAGSAILWRRANKATAALGRARACLSQLSGQNMDLMHEVSSLLVEGRAAVEPWKEPKIEMTAHDLEERFLESVRRPGKSKRRI